jgi:two-component system sensor histidine kinase VanS
MLDELERSFTAAQRFAANASHEIRTPLATTKALLEVAATEDNTPHVDHLLTRLARSNDQLIGVTDALLDLASTRQNPLCSPIEVAELLSAELGEVDSVIVDRGLRVRTHLGEESISGDRGLLKLLIANLVRNAVLHNRPGGYIVAATEPRADGAVAFVIENSGARVTEESLARLSEPFYRVGGRTAITEGPNGHGLGLAIVAAVIDAHRGSLHFEALEPDGLRVTAEFPGADVVQELAPGGPSIGSHV